MNANEVEHADHVSSADTVTTAGHVEVVAGTIVVPQSREAKLIRAGWLVVALLGGLAIILVLMLSRSFVSSANNDRASLNRNVNELRDQLEAQRKALEETKATSDAQDACYNLYVGAARSGNADVLATQAELWIKAFDAMDPDPNVRRQQFTPFVDALRQTVAQYRVAAVGGDAYVAAGRPLPCPIKPKGQP